MGSESLNISAKNAGNIQISSFEAKYLKSGWRLNENNEEMVFTYKPRFPRKFLLQPANEVAGRFLQVCVCSQGGLHVFDLTLHVTIPGDLVHSNLFIGPHCTGLPLPLPLPLPTPAAPRSDTLWQSKELW